MYIKDQKGISLVEMIVVISIMTLLLSGLIAMIVYGYDYQRSSIQQIVALENGRRSLETMTAEMRNIAQADNGAYAIEQAQDQSLIFYADIDGDSQKERVRYYLDGIDFKKGVIEPEGELVTYSGEEQISTLTTYIANGASPIFIYYDESYTGTEDFLSQPVDITDVKLIHILLSIDVDPNRDPDASILETEVQLRNLKTNL